MVRHGDPQYKKAESIRVMVDKELGFAASILANLALQQVSHNINLFCIPSWT